MIDTMLYVSYALLIGCAIAAIVLPLIGSLGNPQSLMRGGIGVAFLLVVFFIGYAISGNEVTPLFARQGVDAGLSKLVGGALIMFYVMAALAIAGIVYSEISKILK